MNVEPTTYSSRSRNRINGVLLVDAPAMGVWRAVVWPLVGKACTDRIREVLPVLGIDQTRLQLRAEQA